MGVKTRVTGDFPSSPTYKKQTIMWVDGVLPKPKGEGNPRTGPNRSKSRKYKRKVDRVILKPMPYVLETSNTQVWEWKGSYSKVSFSSAITGYAAIVPFVRNQMVIDTRDQLDAGLQLAVDFAEARGLIKGVEQRLIKTLKYVSGIKKNTARRLAELSGTARRRNDTHRIPAAWLEWHFMLKPTIQSVNGLVNHLNNPMPTVPIKGRGEGVHAIKNATWNKVITLGMRQGGLVRIKNPNVNLVHQMGLTDVFGVALELTPWSWALGYFINASDLLGNISPKWNQFEYINWYNNQKIQTSGFVTDYIPGTAKKGSLSFDATALYRYLGLVNIVSPQILADLNLQRVSYLCSAIALTMKGKLK